MHTCSIDHTPLEGMQYIANIDAGGVYLVRLNMKAVLNKTVPIFLQTYKNTAANPKHQQGKCG